MNQNFKVFVIKYTLTGNGKILANVPVHREMDPSNGQHPYYYTKASGTLSSVQYKAGRDAFESFDAAVARLEVLRAKKIKALQKQIAKLESMKYTLEVYPNVENS